MSLRYHIVFARRGDAAKIDKRFLASEGLDSLLEIPPEQFMRVVYESCFEDEKRLRQSVADYARRIGEAIGIAIQDNVELFVYFHFRGAKVMRALSYSADGGWYRVEGEPEGWEATAIVDRNSSAPIVRGSQVPKIFAHDVAERVLASYGLELRDLVADNRR